MGIQIIKTPGGDEMVVLSRAEYEALVNAAEEAFEDAADSAAYDAAMAALTPDSILPVDVSRFVTKGDSLLRACRKWRGMSQQQVAAAAGVTQGFLSDLETRRRSLTPDMAAELTKVLSLPESWLRP